MHFYDKKVHFIFHNVMCLPILECGYFNAMKYDYAMRYNKSVKKKRRQLPRLEQGSLCKKFW